MSEKYPGFNGIFYLMFLKAKKDFQIDAILELLLKNCPIKGLKAAKAWLKQKGDNS